MKNSNNATLQIQVTKKAIKKIKKNRNSKIQKKKKIMNLKIFPPKNRNNSNNNKKMKIRIIQSLR